MAVDSPEVLDELFEIFDDDSSGCISLKEVHHALRWVDSCENCQKMRSAAYLSDGTLSIQEQIRNALAANAVKVLDLFREWDRDGDGLVSEKEFLQAMPMLGIHCAKEEVRLLFATLDGDGDGIITFKEFNRLLKRESEAQVLAREAEGRGVGSEWQPASPRVEMVDLHALRKQIHVEQRMRGLHKSDISEEARALLARPWGVKPTNGAPSPGEDG